MYLFLYYSHILFNVRKTKLVSIDSKQIIKENTNTVQIFLQGKVLIFFQQMKLLSNPTDKNSLVLFQVLYIA